VKIIKVVGQAERVSFPDYDLENIPARIDTGARSSAVWASHIKETNGKLTFTFFDASSDLYTGKRIETKQYSKSVVASSNGQVQQRYVVRLLVKLKGKKVHTKFTLADRSSQVYPVLIGRRLLFGKFLVDVRAGRPLRKKERQRTEALQSLLKKDTVK
jgi:hypothetical protein